MRATKTGIQPKPPVTDDFVSVDLRMFVAEKPPYIDLYLRLGDRDPVFINWQARQHTPVPAADGSHYVLYCEAATVIGRDSRARLLDNGVNRLYYRLSSGSVCAGGQSLSDVLDRPDTEVPAMVKSSLVYEHVFAAGKQLLQEPGGNELLAATSASVRTIVRHVVRSPHALHGLIGLMRHDPSLFTHSANVCTYATALGRHLGLDGDDLVNLGTGALIHDVGMTRVPQTILDKPGALTPQDRATVERHPNWGTEILATFLRRRPEIRAVVAQHHERLDGSGYPLKLKGAQIHKYARITGFVDRYDAMTSDRPYRPAMNPFKAMQLIRDGTIGQFENDLFMPMLRMLGPRR